jgi:hypothetical protein
MACPPVDRLSFGLVGAACFALSTIQVRVVARDFARSVLKTQHHPLLTVPSGRMTAPLLDAEEQPPPGCCASLWLLLSENAIPPFSRVAPLTMSLFGICWIGICGLYFVGATLGQGAPGQCVVTGLSHLAQDILFDFGTVCIGICALAIQYGFVASYFASRGVVMTSVPGTLVPGWFRTVSIGLGVLTFAVAIVSDLLKFHYNSDFWRILFHGYEGTVIPF